MRGGCGCVRFIRELVFPLCFVRNSCSRVRFLVLNRIRINNYMIVILLCYKVVQIAPLAA